MVHFAEINQAPPLYSMLQYIVPINCLRYLQTTLIMVGRGMVSEFMWGIVEASIDKLRTKYKDLKQELRKSTD